MDSGVKNEEKRDWFVVAREELMRENRRRNRAIELLEDYDPIAGVGSEGPRDAIANLMTGFRVHRVPVSMRGDERYDEARNDRGLWERLRCRYDFEYWAARCARIQDKQSGAIVPFVLNRPQRRVLGVMEEMRRAGRPIRLILLKARQWGGSTLVQMYMAWIQTCLRENWNSFICGHRRDASANIFRMYDNLIRYYPGEMWEGDERRFVPVKGSSSIRQLTGRGCCVTVSSSESQNSVRGQDIAMAHLSEVAFWRKTEGRDPRQVIRAITGAVDRRELTLIALESTADGPGNYFHDEWVKAVGGLSDKKPVFVAWHEIPFYRSRLPDDDAGVERFIASLDEYERWLFNEQGVTLENLMWYHLKRRESPSHALFMSEYPSTAAEAFQATDMTVFAPEGVERLRAGCLRECRRGEVVSGVTGHPTSQESLLKLRYEESSTGQLYVWEEPRRDCRYIVAVDIGGRTVKADWSVIAVIKRRGDGVDRPEVVAQMRVHIDHDLLAWTAARVATWYNMALLAFESNTLESGSSGSDFTPYILDTIGDYYPNLYYRTSGVAGFHTNRMTKPVIISHLIAMVRDGRYIERSSGALDEMSNYIVSRSGAYGARQGHHDDILMTRAIGLHLADMPDEGDSEAADREASEYLRSGY